MTIPFTYPTMWRKARVVKGDKELLGLTLWVIAKPPVRQRFHELSLDLIDIADSEVTAVESNLLDPNGHRAFIDIGDIELLAEFAANVPLISVDTFLGGK